MNRPENDMNRPERVFSGRGRLKLSKNCLIFLKEIIKESVFQFRIFSMWDWDLSTIAHCDDLTGNILHLCQINKIRPVAADKAIIILELFAQIIQSSGAVQDNSVLPVKQ